MSEFPPEDIDKQSPIKHPSLTLGNESDKLNMNKSTHSQDAAQTSTQEGRQRSKKSSISNTQAQNIEVQQNNAAALPMGNDFQNIHQQYPQQQNFHQQQNVPEYIMPQQQQQQMMYQQNYYPSQGNLKYSPMQTPPKAFKKLYRITESPLHRVPWNGRFFLSSVMNNALPHQFFREYFDKPYRQKQESLIKPEKPDIPIEEFYRSSSLSQLLFDHAGVKSQKGSSKMQSSKRNYLQRVTSSKSSAALKSSNSHKNLLTQEFNWEDKFGIMASKNNIQVHKAYQEYFDRPIDYDVRGYAYSKKFEPMICYERQTPIVDKLKYLNRISSQNFSRNSMRASQNQQRFSKTAQSGMRRSMDDVRRPMTQGQSKRFISTANSKFSTGASDLVRISKPGWSDRIGMPISKYNETVYPRYKILFEDL